MEEEVQIMGRCKLYFDERRAVLVHDVAMLTRRFREDMITPPSAERAGNAGLRFVN